MSHARPRNLVFAALALVAAWAPAATIAAPRAALTTLPAVHAVPSAEADTPAHNASQPEARPCTPAAEYRA